MCTMIVERTALTGCAKGAQGWFPVTGANVGYDHPFHLPIEHALTIDFVNEAAGPGARVAVELTAQSAQLLADAILAALARGAVAEARV